MKVEMEFQGAWDKQTIVVKDEGDVVSIQGKHNFQDCYEIGRTDVSRLISFLKSAIKSKNPKSPRKEGEK
jgi:hypothetical protein